MSLSEPRLLDLPTRTVPDEVGLDNSSLTVL